MTHGTAGKTPTPRVFPQPRELFSSSLSVTILVRRARQARAVTWKLRPEYFVPEERTAAGKRRCRSAAAARPEASRAAPEWHFAPPGDARAEAAAFARASAA